MMGTLVSEEYESLGVTNQSHNIWLWSGSFDLSEKEVRIVLLKRKKITVLKIVNLVIKCTQPHKSSCFSN